MKYEEDRERAEAGTVPYDGTRLVKRQVKPVKTAGETGTVGARRSGQGREEVCVLA